MAKKVSRPGRRKTAKLGGTFTNETFAVPLGIPVSWTTAEILAYRRRAMSGAPIPWRLEHASGPRAGDVEIVDIPLPEASRVRKRGRPPTKRPDVVAYLADVEQFPDAKIRMRAQRLNVSERTIGRLGNETNVPPSRRSRKRRMK